MPQSLEVAVKKHDGDEGEIETPTSLLEFPTVPEMLQYLKSNFQQLEQNGLSVVLQLDNDPTTSQWEQITAQIIEEIYSVRKKMYAISLSSTGSVGRYKITLDPLL